MIKTFNITTYTITSYMQTIRSIPPNYHYTIPHTPFAQWSKKKRTKQRSTKHATYFKENKMKKQYHTKHMSLDLYFFVFIYKVLVPRSSFNGGTPKRIRGI